MKTTIMKLRLIVILVIIKAISAKINIDIKAGADVNDIDINFSGHDLKVVTDHEIEVFGIDKNIIAEAVRSHYGTKPTNVYLKSPTPWGDLYKTYSWEQVSRVLSVRSATVKNIKKQPTVMLSQDFENVSNYTIKVNTGMSQTVENTVSTSWTRNTDITVSQEIEYGLNVFFAKAAGKTGFSYTTSWGKTEEKVETVTIGTTAGVETELKPGQTALAVLSANRGFLEVEVIYEAKLRGYVAANYKRKFRGHHFWFPAIDSVMKSAKLINERTAVEVIKIGYYSDATLKMYDKQSGLPL